jgi:hypothetical protein
MDASLFRALETLRKHPDYSDGIQAQWTDQDFQVFRDKTGLVMPRGLEQIYREVGMPQLDATELYFNAQFEDGSTEEGETQIIFNRPERVIGFHQDFTVGDQHAPRLPEGYVVFGTADGGNSFLLTKAGSEESPIYYWKLAFDPFGEGDNARGLAKVANSLSEFLASLRTADELG